MGERRDAHSLFEDITEGHRAMGEAVDEDGLELPLSEVREYGCVHIPAWREQISANFHKGG